MQRRTYLKAAGSIGTVSALGIGASILATNPVSATQDFEGEVSLSSDTGEIDHVSIYGDSYMEWKGFDTPATQVQILTHVRVFDDNDNKVAHKTVNDTGKRELSVGEDWGNHDDYFSGEGTRGYVHHGVGVDRDGNHDPDIDWAIIQASDYEDPYGLPQDPVDADNLTVPKDGGTQSYTVELVTDYILYAADGTNLVQSELGQDQIRAESAFEVTVENIAASAETGDKNDDDGATGGASNEGELLE